VVSCDKIAEEKNRATHPSGKNAHFFGSSRGGAVLVDRRLSSIDLPFCERRQLSEKELEWDRAARGPRILVMFCFGKREVK